MPLERFDAPAQLCQEYLMLNDLKAGILDFMIVRARVQSQATKQALGLLGAQIRIARRERGWTINELAARVGVSRVTIGNLEVGDPGVAVGTVFEAAVLVGVPLFHESPDRLRVEATRARDWLALLPERVRSKAVDDDF